MKKIIAGILLLVLLFSSITTTTFAKKVEKVEAQNNNEVYEEKNSSEDEISSIRAFNYALFSGNTITELAINSSSIDIDGNIHTNSNFVFHGSNLRVAGIESSGKVDIKAPNVEVASITENADIISLPEDIVANIKNIALEDAYIFDKSKMYNGNIVNLDKAVIANGDITFNSSNLRLNGYVIAKNDISFNTSKITSDNSKGIVICSEGGNIRINSSTVEINGIIYAPKGTVTINCASFILKGRIIADKIIIRGSKQKIISRTDDMDLIYKEADIIFSSIKDEYDCLSQHEICFTVIDNEGEPVPNVKYTINVTGNATVTSSLVTDENGRGVIIVCFQGRHN